MDWYFPGENAGVGCHFHYPGDLPDPGIESVFPAHVSCIAGEFFNTEPPGKPF